MSEKKNKILVVDDTKHVVVLLKHYCQKAGYLVSEAFNGPDALEKLKEDKPDIILLDVMMPGMDGFTVAEHIRNDENTKFIPIIMVTALSELEDRVKALSLGVDDFLTKPVDELLLITKIRSLLKAKAEREELDKIKFEYTSMLVHDLRTPLTSIIGFAKVLETEEQDEEKKKFLEVILQNSSRMMALVNDFLDFSKLGAGKFEISKSPAVITMIIDNVLHSLNILALNKGIEIVKEYQEDLPIINIDARKIEQVTMNLVSNAIKYTPQNGKIIIKSLAENGFLKVSVSDNGTGISEEEQDKIFIPYYQSHSGKTSSEKGTGLGLVIAKMIIDGHGGSIKVKSKLGEGSLFTYTLPIEEL